MIDQETVVQLEKKYRLECENCIERIRKNAFTMKVFQLQIAHRIKENNQEQFVSIEKSRYPYCVDECKLITPTHMRSNPDPSFLYYGQ